MALIPWWINYPNVNDEILNLDWLLTVANENTEKISNFINLNTIKYANPILWDITSQYEANTIVVDPQTGDAYISTQAVPYGVALSNDSYWTKIYNYADAIKVFHEQIAAADEQLSTTATAPRAIGDLVWLNGLLYRVTAEMIAGDSYVVGSNCVKTTIEEELKREMTARAEADTALSGRITDEATARAEADTALGQRIDDEAQARADADTALGGRIDDEAQARKDAIGNLSELHTSIKTNIVASINEVLKTIPNIITASSLGLIPNDNTKGSTNSSLINAALADSHVILLDENTYYIDSALVLADKSGIIGTSRRGSVIKTNAAINMIEVPVTFTSNVTPYWDIILSNFSLEGAYHTTLSGIKIYNYTYKVTCNSDFSAYVALKGDAYALELRNSPINNLYIQAPNDGIKIDDVIALVSLNNIFIETCYDTGLDTAAFDSMYANINITYCNTGIKNTGGDSKWSNCKIFQNGRRQTDYVVNYTDAFGIYFEGANRNQLVNFQVEENGGVGAIFKDCKSLMIDLNTDANGFITNDNNYKLGVEFLGTCVDISGRISATDKNTEMFGTTTQRVGIYISNTSSAFDVEYTEYGNALKYYASGLHTVSLLKGWKTYFSCSPARSAAITGGSGDPLFATFDGEFLNIHIQGYTADGFAAGTTVANITRPDMTDYSNVYNCPSYIPCTIFDDKAGTAIEGMIDPSGNIICKSAVAAAHSIIIRDSIKMFF